MRKRLSVVAALLLPVLLLGLTACKRSGARGEAPIKGSRSDPAQVFVGRWDSTNDYIYRLEALTGTQVPRRNSEVVVQQDTTLAEDFRLSVTNVAPDGGRSLMLEIQSVQVETTSDQRLTSAFDTENELISTEDNPVASRLQKVKGARLGFRLSPENRVLRVDGTKEFNDRVGANRSVRGVAGAVLNRFFNQQFYRDLLELSFLPTNSVRIGDSWTIKVRSIGGLYNNPAADVTYTFRGWQVREGTNCARFDFTGAIKPPSGPPNRGPGQPPPPATFEEALFNGTTWFSPDLGVPVEMSLDQTITRQSVSNSNRSIIRTNVQPPGATSPGEPARTNVVINVTDIKGDPANQTLRKTTTQQHVTLTLTEVVPVGEPESRK